MYIPLSLSLSLILIFWADYVWLLIVYELLQMAILILQELYNPRFFIPSKFDIFPKTERWDYFPASLPTDLESGDSSVDCIICMEKIELRNDSTHKEFTMDDDERESLLEKGKRNSAHFGQSLGRWSYMVDLFLLL